MNTFCDDFENGLEEGRYVAGEMLLLPINDQEFELALCSHFLCLYSGHLSLQFHLSALQDMMRAAKRGSNFSGTEVRK